MRSLLRLIPVLSLPAAAALYAPGAHAQSPNASTTSGAGQATGTTTVGSTTSSGFIAATPAGGMPKVDPNEPSIDTNTTQRTFFNKPLFFTGLTLLAASYAPAFVVAATSDRSADDKLYYPVAGPWMNLKDRDCDVRECGNEGLNKGLLIADGIVQGLGALSIVGSLVIPEKTTRKWYLIGGDSWRVVPGNVGRTGQGLVALGTF